MGISAVVPTCRSFQVPEQSVPVKWYVVHDVEEREVSGERVDIIAPDPEMYGQRASSIRGAGVLQAYLDGADYILTVDDDCHIPFDWAERHAWVLGPRPLWTNTIDQIYVRGYPKTDGDTETAISHGLWNGVPDLSGETQVELGAVYLRHEDVWRPIEAPFPMSSMNVGFTRAVAPLMYFWPMGGVFDRYEDIWCGICAQRVLSLWDYRFVNGGAVVYHSRASDAQVNSRKEAPGKEIHERLWQYIWCHEEMGDKPSDTFLLMANHIERFRSGDEEWDRYFSQVSRNMRTWVDLLDQR